jgi:hypothetical protein
MLHDSPNQTRLIAKVIREVMATGSYSTLSDLTAAVKTRCARLRLRATADTINGAYTLIASNTALVHEERPRLEPTAIDPPALKHREAAAILRRLGVFVGGGRLSSARAAAPSSPDAPEDFPSLVEVRSW